jgi:arylsulfatase A-like enzyme
MTDDENLADMSVMPQTRSLIGDQGTTFANVFANDPLCCPSRSTFLTGQYAHNHGVVTGNGFGDLDSSNTVGVWLQNAGYHTGFVGKYVNGYGRPNAGGRTLVPPGWSEWYGALPPDQAMYDYDVNENGTIVHYGTGAADFKGDAITDRALDFINRNGPSAVPFFLTVGYTAPHSTDPLDGSSYVGCDNAADPAPRHTGAFADVGLPSTPSMNEANVSDKPADVASLPSLTAGALSELQRQLGCRLASLLYVDDGVARIVAALRDAGELDRTLIIFVSDNGFLLGEHRIAGSKVYPYEESIHVPLMMRGPGVPAGQTESSLASNADLAPTIVDLAGATPGLVEDGTSLRGLIGDNAPDRDLVIESYVDDQTHDPYVGVRTTRYAYFEYSNGDRELYDLTRDPYELRNRASDSEYAPPRDWLAARVAALRACKGEACRSYAGQPPARLDLTAPRTKLRAPKRQLHTAGGKRRARFRFTANEKARFRCRLDHRHWHRCSSPKRVRLAVGRHKFRVAAIDAAGNRDRTPARWHGRVRLRKRSAGR